MAQQKRIGLALSGGGYRAAAFHLGVLNKLNELNILPKVAVISTISGGSITGAAYSLSDKNYEKFRAKLYDTLLKKSVITKIIFSWRFLFFLLYLIIVPLLDIYFFGKHPIVTCIILSAYIFMLIKFQFVLFPVSKIIEKAYDKFFFHGKTLSDLGTSTELAINATNLETGRPFTFSKRKMGDSYYTFQKQSAPIKFKHDNFPISRAVMASTCVPHAFTPVQISKHFFENEADFFRCTPLLIDGGIYDNQGIHKITQNGSSYECEIIITSDAGVSLPIKKKYKNTLVLLIRTIDLFMQRIKYFQLINNVYRNVQNGSNKEIAYFSLGWDLESCLYGFVDNLKNENIVQEVVEAHNIPQFMLKEVERYRADIIQILKSNVEYNTIFSRNLTKENLTAIRNIGTNLRPFGKQKLDYIIQHAENLTELQVKLYCPTLINIKYAI
ncbi:NTE family protein [Chitinophaga niastensis]|uniref:NTE family protein n=1 Tax=Chitinophaga niastensis TaxID=536980 RepID=A0A2P8HFK2_CHINA|nr:patatin-like phospholipase family protein [Chitinophaga niastensis]PSL44974.1 NTE family protein [Chitinophaga niastensis]